MDGPGDDEHDEQRHVQRVPEREEPLERPELEHASRRADTIVDVAVRRQSQRLAARVVAPVRPFAMASRTARRSRRRAPMAHIAPSSGRSSSGVAAKRRSTTACSSSMRRASAGRKDTVDVSCSRLENSFNSSSVASRPLQFVVDAAVEIAAEQAAARHDQHADQRDVAVGRAEAEVRVEQDQRGPRMPSVMCSLNQERVDPT